MRRTTTALLVTMALSGAAATSAPAQEPPKETSAEAAEDAFLKAYFSERELKDHGAAEKAYAALLATNPASREVRARALLGRGRCLRELRRDAEADAAFARVEKEFTDLPRLADEAKAARAAMSPAAGGKSVEALIREAVTFDDWKESVPRYGDRATPVLAELLNDDQPEIVQRAAGSLARIGTSSAMDVLVNALETGRSSYPLQVAEAVVYPNLPIQAVSRLAQCKVAEVRLRALSELIYGRDDPSDALFAAVVSDAEMRPRFLGAGAGSASKAFGKLLVAAIAAGGEARGAALARNRGAEDWAAVGEVLLAPPDAVLKDAEAVRAIAERAWTGGEPSRAFVAACLKIPETQAFAVRWTLQSGAPAADPDGFVDSIARHGFEGWPFGWNDERFAAALVRALGAAPGPERLRRLAAAWPHGREESLQPFVAQLAAAGVTDEASYAALSDGADGPRLRTAFVFGMYDVWEEGSPLGVWMPRVLSRDLKHQDPSMREKAIFVMRRARETSGADLRPFVRQLAERLDDYPGVAKEAQAALVGIGADAVRPVVETLAGAKSKARAIDVLAQIGDESVFDDVARVLGATDERAVVVSAAAALAKFRGDDAKDAFAAAIVGHDGRSAGTILQSSGFESLGVVARFELFQLALAKVPGKLDLDGKGAYASLDWVPAERRRELAIVGLKSPAARDRAWGAWMESMLLDVAAWDALLAAAQDLDVDVRDGARDALRAIRAKENEMAEFRAMGEERATRARIEKLVASKEPRERRAGVAAIAATGLAGMVNELIRLAAEDPDGDVCEDARRALLAVARPSAPASAPTEKK